MVIPGAFQAGMTMLPRLSALQFTREGSDRTYVPISDTMIDGNILMRSHNYGGHINVGEMWTGNRGRTPRGRDELRPPVVAVPYLGAENPNLELNDAIAANYLALRESGRIEAPRTRD